MWRSSRVGMGTADFRRHIAVIGLAFSLLRCGSSDHSSGANGGSGGSGVVFRDPGLPPNGPWQNRTPTPPLPADWPPDGQMQRLVYDGARQRVLLFGGGIGDDSWSQSNELYAWDGAGGSWVRLTPTPLPAAWPAPRGGHAMAWDEQRRKLVVFGGFQVMQLNVLTALADVWELDGDTLTWQNRTPDTLPSAWPSPRYDHSLVYDSARGKVVLFGGTADVPSFPVYDDLWEWDGDAGTWTDRTPSPLPSTWPPAREGAAMIYDSVRQRTVLFAGDPYENIPNDLWEWDGSTFVDRAPNPLPASWPAARGEEAFAFDPVHDQMLFYGGYAPILGDTWVWNAATNDWTRQNVGGPSPRRAASMAFDVARGRAVLYGGQDVELGLPLRDTWEYDTAGIPDGGAGSASTSLSCTDEWMSTDPGALELLDPIPTAGAHTAARSFHLFSLDAGPGGCIADLTVDLGNCRIGFGPKRDASGAFMMQPLEQGISTWCQFEGLGDALQGTLSFTGTSCKRPMPTALAAPDVCYSGTFELRLTSTDASGSPVLTGAPFHLGGPVCAISGGDTSTCTP